MGYYVMTKEVSFMIPKEKLDEAFKAVCELNQHNDLKRGGRWPRDEKDGPHENVWFSWMPWDYHETCDGLGEVLEHLGFEVADTENGGLVILYYDSKTGQETLFLEALAPFVAEGSFIEWMGEDQTFWRDFVKDGKLIQQAPNITWE